MGLALSPVLLLLAGGTATAIEVSVTGPAGMVWNYRSQVCDWSDFSDVPVRPFLNARGEVVWISGNSDGYRLTKGKPDARDRLAPM
jgi:hypothetical protein